MEKLPMCRICLVKDVRMYVVVNKNLHELYEKLTDVPFVTEDSRPMFACFFCCAKLKQCWRFQRKCLEAEELFTKMMNEDYEHDPLITQGKLSFCHGFMKMPVENINIVDACQTESGDIVIKEELPDCSENLDDIIEPKKFLQTGESKLDNVDNSYPDVEATAALQQSDSDDDVPLLEIKTQVEIELEPIWPPVVKKPKRDRTRSPSDTIPVEHIKIENYPQLPVLKKETAHKHSNNHGVNTSFNNSMLGASSRNNSKKKYLKCETSNESNDCDKTPYKCDICQKILKRKRTLKIHMLVHTNEKPFKCSICQKAFKSKDNLRSHSYGHTREGPFKCEICQKSFERKRNYKSHIRVHNVERPYKCTICHQSFFQKSDLVTHTRVHTGEKPFKCDVCQKGFRQIGNLTHHIRTHTGEKPYKCDICQRGFTQKSNLLYHIRSHTGEKPFKCEICRKGFSKKGNFTKHTCRRQLARVETKVEEVNQ